MSPAARPLALAAVALVVLLVALATDRRTDPPGRGPAVVLPESGRWQTAVAAPLADPVTPTGCGFVLQPQALAVSHPVLPCAIRVVIDVDGATAAVQVAGRAGAPGGAAFGLTPELARALRIEKAVVVRWALAAG